MQTFLFFLSIWNCLDAGNLLNINFILEKNTKMNIAQTKALLKFHWPMSNFSEVVSGANIVSGSNYAFLKGSNNQPYAINLTLGYLKLPQNSLLSSGDYSFSFNVQWNSFGTNSRIFDFNSGSCTFNVAFYNKFSNRSLFEFRTWNGRPQDVIQSKENYVELGSWNYFTIVYKYSANTVYLYLNAQLHKAATMTNPSTMLMYNAFGQSCSSSDALFNGAIDDFKIYQGMLTSTEILLECLSFTPGFTN